MTRIQELTAILRILETKQLTLKNAESSTKNTEYLHSLAIEVNTMHLLLQNAVSEYLNSINQHATMRLVSEYKADNK